jgi:hypothetical protein
MVLIRMFLRVILSNQLTGGSRYIINTTILKLIFDVTHKVDTIDHEPGISTCYKDELPNFPMLHKEVQVRENGFNQNVFESDIV